MVGTQEPHLKHAESNEGFCPFVFYCNEDCLQQSYLYDYGIAGSLSIFSILISLYFICMHRSYYTNPHFQSKIIDERVYIRMIEAEREITHMFPFNICTKPYKLTRCKKYVLQYFVFKPALSVILLIMELFIGSESSVLVFFISIFVFNLLSLKAQIASYIRIFVGISVTYSLYYLILFYHALKTPLSPWHPLLKFLVIKITLFFTFWQDLTLENIIREPLLNCFDKSSIYFNDDRIIHGIENTLVCFEMCLMAIAGGIAYSYKPFLLGIVKSGGFSDVFKDNWKTFQKDFRLIKPKKFGFKETHKQIDYVQTYRPSISKSVDIEFDTPQKNLYDQLNPSYV